MLHLDNIIHINPHLYNILDTIFISPIYILDLFPVMKNKRLSTLGTIYSLQEFKEISEDDILYTFVYITDQELLSKIKGEQNIAAKLSILHNNLHFIKHNKQNPYDIYNLVQVFYILRKIIRDNKYFSSNNILIPELLSCTKVDPLLISVLLHERHFVLRYVDDFKSNRFSKVRSYRYSLNNDTIRNIMRCYVIPKVWYLKQILLLLHVDIYRYVILSEIF